MRSPICTASGPFGAPQETASIGHPHSDSPAVSFRSDQSIPPPYSYIRPNLPIHTSIQHICTSVCGCVSWPSTVYFNYLCLSLYPTIYPSTSTLCSSHPSICALPSILFYLSAPICNMSMSSHHPYLYLPPSIRRTRVPICSSIHPPLLRVDLSTHLPSIHPSIYPYALFHPSFNPI